MARGGVEWGGFVVRQGDSEGTPPAAAQNRKTLAGESACPTCPTPLKLRVAGGSREGDDVANVFHPGEIHQHPLKTHAEAGVVHAAEAAQIQVPPVGLFLQAVSRPVAD